MADSGLSDDVSFAVSFPAVMVSLCNELSVEPSVGKTIGVPDVTDIDPSVDEVVFVDMVSVLLVSNGVTVVDGASVVVVVVVDFVVIEVLVGLLIGLGVVVLGFFVVDLLGVTFCVVVEIMRGVLLGTAGLTVVVATGVSIRK